MSRGAKRVQKGTVLPVANRSRRILGSRRPPQSFDDVITLDHTLQQIRDDTQPALLTWVIRRQCSQGSLFVVSQRCIGARPLEKYVRAAQNEITIPVLNIFYPQAQVREMLENLIRMLGPLGTFKGGENTAVSDDANDKQHSHDRAERGLYFQNNWQLYFHLNP